MGHPSQKRGEHSSQRALSLSLSLLQTHSQDVVAFMKNLLEPGKAIVVFSYFLATHKLNN
jgi:hypothetical protein